MYRSEYPRPQFVRENWINLNGPWEYQTDRGISGMDRKLFLKDATFSETIEVPFCRESELSGIGDKDFCAAVWYRKTVKLPESWQGKRVLFHVGACDFKTVLFANEKRVGEHVGGFASFTFDITSYIEDGEVTLTLYVTDNVRSGNQAAGKQSPRSYSWSCFYTRTTGIWQTVWLEAVEKQYLRGAKYYPDIEAQSLTVHALACGAHGETVTAKAYWEGKEVGEASGVVCGEQAILTLKLSELHLWELGKGRLYDLELTLGADTVKSYFGMRSIGMKDGIFYLNGKPTFQRLVLDQGFYPDGILTAPSDAALIADIERSMALGFNGARLHQKVFEERFLYHCDRLGYIVWGEEGNWNLDIKKPEAWSHFIPEWMEVLERDFNHPAIIGWCPMNETQYDCDLSFIQFLSDMTKAYDPTRLYIDASGWRHLPNTAKTDLIDLHDYDQNPETFRAMMAPLLEGKPVSIHLPGGWPVKEYTYPNFVSEYGGILWDPKRIAVESAGSGNTVGAAWGYGNAPQTEDEFFARYEGLTKAILDHPCMTALCYTQLTDVEQEQNGLYTYDRQLKFDAEKLRRVMTLPAAIEENS